MDYSFWGDFASTVQTLIHPMDPRLESGSGLANRGSVVDIILAI